MVRELEVPPMPAELLGEGYIFGSLFQVAGFPGLVYDAKRQSRAFGEIYLIKEKKRFFEEMDKYELAHPNYQGPDAMFHRRVRPALISHNFIIPCWVYEYIGETKNLQRIRNGRFQLFS